MSSARPDPNALLARLPLTPDIHLQKVDLTRQAVLAIEFSETAYRAASFLDDRILTPTTQGAWLPLQQVIERATTVRQAQPVNYIFHSGHVGSTLVSRLLDETSRVLSIREPLILRNLADVWDALELPESLVSPPAFTALLNATMRLWGRGYAGTQQTVIKATSSASRMWRPLLEGSAASRSVWLNLRIEPYLAILLSGANSPIDLRGHAPGRMRRLQQRVTNPLRPLHSLTLGELAAMSWLVETWTRHEAAAHDSAAVLSLDFDEFLRDVPAGMHRVVTHFGISDTDAFIAQVAASPALSRYSKAVNLPYSSEVRTEVLRESRLSNAQEIRAGMTWLERLAQDEPTVARIISAQSG